MAKHPCVIPLTLRPLSQFQLPVPTLSMLHGRQARKCLGMSPARRWPAAEPAAVPLILVAAGTGVGPFRAYLQERHIARQHYFQQQQQQSEGRKSEQEEEENEHEEGGKARQRSFASLWKTAGNRESAAQDGPPALHDPLPTPVDGTVTPISPDTTLMATPEMLGSSWNPTEPGSLAPTAATTMTRATSMAMSSMDSRTRKDMDEMVFGEVDLFFGCRRRWEDFLFDEEWAAWEGSGDLSSMQVCFSREQNGGYYWHGGCYVQDQLIASGFVLCERLMVQKAKVYVCGDAMGMVREVSRAFVEIFKTHLRCSEKEAKELMTELVRSGRYVTDVWAR